MSPLTAFANVGSAPYEPVNVYAPESASRSARICASLLRAFAAMSAARKFCTTSGLLISVVLSKRSAAVAHLIRTFETDWHVTSTIGFHVAGVATLTDACDDSVQIVDPAETCDSL